MKNNIRYNGHTFTEATIEDLEELLVSLDSLSLDSSDDMRVLRVYYDWANGK
jgi:hypothetical protein